MSAHRDPDPEGGRRDVEAFAAWAASNRASWLRLCDVVRRMGAAGAVVQRGRVYGWAIAHGVDVSDVAAFRRDNNLWPAASRYMLRYLGEGCGVRTRASRIDDAYPTPAELPELPLALRP